MDSSDISANPFAALFPSLDHAKQYQQISLASDKEEDPVAPPKDSSYGSVLQDKVQEAIELNRIVESVFLLTLDPEPDDTISRPSRCVYLKDTATALGNPTVIGQDVLEQVVFERLMLAPEDITDQLTVTRPTKHDTKAAMAAGEKDVLVYLSQCYARCKQLQQEFKAKNMSLRKYDFAYRCEKVIVSNGRMCLQQPFCFTAQTFETQFIDILREDLVFSGSGEGVSFLRAACQEVEASGEAPSLPEVLSGVLGHAHSQLRPHMHALHASTPRTQLLSILTFFTSNASLAEVFMAYNMPRTATSALGFESTLLGCLLSPSCIPRSERGPYEFFNSPSSQTKQEHDITESNIWMMSSALCDSVANLLFPIIKLSPALRNKVLTWMANCLHANAGRSKLWSSMSQLFSQSYCSEGFALNLCHVLLRLCQPFARPLSPKLLKIQPSYTAVVVSSQEEADAMGVHTKDLQGETPLVTAEDVDPLPRESSYGFVTELFFLTQQALRIGFHAVHDKLVKLNQDLSRVQRVYHDARQQLGSDEEEPVRGIKQQMEKGMTLFLSLKAALSQSQLLEMSLNFHLGVASWLCQVATQPVTTATFQPVTFPLPDDTLPALTHIPEYVLGNLTDFVLYLHQFKEDMFEVAGESIHHLMSLVLVFMGSPARIKNPHLRAELADMLSALLPNRSNAVGLFTRYAREQVFKTHPLVSHLAETLLHVFVSIEMTGQAVEFEQKFNYRRPMYLILDHIWEIELHQQALEELAEYAESHIEESDAPLFLRFINLLVNDATFLLDEALSYMSQIKTKQQERGSGAWSSLSPEQRQEQEGLLRQVGMMARYHNVMARHTIHALQLLTSRIKTIFCHPTFADRVAAMLNYFLCRLVGPKQREFSVKDREEFEFKPQVILLEIVQIYLNLESSDRFCAGILSDERSYSEDLLQQTAAVLQKVSQSSQLIADFMTFQEKIKDLEEQRHEEEEHLADAPEEFLDPILGTLMADPVRLPTSNTVMDRAVIARHILSDQSDPFNRKPLTMDMVVAETALKDRIQRWTQDRKAKS